MITYSELGQFGRLGNQLFQIAATIALANRNGDGAIFPAWEYNLAFKKQIMCTTDFSWVRSIHREPSFEYSPIPYRHSTDLYGYFQSEKYFADCRNLILDQFDFVDGTVTDEQINDASESCSIHVRRTDYVALANYHPFPGMEYYKSAIADMEAVGIKKFMIFSDDIPWCMSTFGSDSKFTYVTNQSNVQDMCLMSKCNSNIIANSSFSWFGAWLNRTENKRVIAPAVWFGPGNAHANPKDLYCEGWIVK